MAFVSMNAEQFKAHYQLLLRRFEGWLSEEFAETTVEPALWAPCRYMLESPGKRIRPVLTLATAELLGVSPELLRGFALAVELLHTASLVHDDLPALDNDDIRRGRPTCHKAFDEARALLAGDLLIIRAFQLLAAETQPPTAGPQLSALLAGMAVALCEGQVLDLEAVRVPDSTEGRGAVPASGVELTPADIEQIYRKKTGALFESCLLAPLAFVEPSKRSAEEGSLRELAVALGLLFQLTDDLLDAPAEVGAPQGTGSQPAPVRELSFVVRFGREATSARIDSLMTVIRTELRRYGASGEFLQALAEQVCTRSS